MTWSHSNSGANETTKGVAEESQANIDSPLVSIGDSRKDGISCSHGKSRGCACKPAESSANGSNVSGGREQNGAPAFFIMDEFDYPLLSPPCPTQDCSEGTEGTVEAGVLPRELWGLAIRKSEPIEVTDVKHTARKGFSSYAVEPRHSCSHVISCVGEGGEEVTNRVSPCSLPPSFPVENGTGGQQ